jgi:hypothetical protein
MVQAMPVPGVATILEYRAFLYAKSTCTDIIILFSDAEELD